MSTPIHNIRDGVIPSVGAHAQVTEAHKALWTKLYNLAYDEIFDVASSDGPATQLIADSEARAMQEMASRIQAAFHEPLIKERDQLRQQVANLTFSNNAHRETAEAWRSAAIERDQLRQQVERLKDRESNQSARIRYLEGATNHATGTPLSHMRARAERAEAALQNCEITLGLNMQRADEAEAKCARFSAEVDRLNIELGAFRSTQDDLRETRNRAVERMNEATTRAEKAEAELAKERARLAHIIKSCENGAFYHVESLAHIDAAMKEDKL